LVVIEYVDSCVHRTLHAPVGVQNVEAHDSSTIVSGRVNFGRGPVVDSLQLQARLSILLERS